MKYNLRFLLAGMLIGYMLATIPWVMRPARAADVSLPVTATLVQCGKKADIEAACAADERCCVFLGQIAPAAGEIISPMAEWTPSDDARLEIEVNGETDILRAEEAYE